MPLPYSNYRDGAASQPIEVEKREPDEAQEYDVLEAAAEDLCKSIEKKDYKAIASALRAAFELLDSEPHEEGPHV